MPPSSARGTGGSCASIPSAPSAARAARTPSARQPAVENTPAAAPQGKRFGTAPSAGRKAARSSRHTGRPPRWQVRWTVGFHPPDTASASARIARSPPACRTTISSIPARPRVPTTRAPAKAG